MRRSSSLKSRIGQLEENRAMGAVNLTFSDHSKQSFNFSGNDRLKVLLASFDLARAARNPEAKLSSSPRAREIARAIATAERVTPPSRLWATIKGTIENAERECTNRARDPESR